MLRQLARLEGARRSASSSTRRTTCAPSTSRTTTTTSQGGKDEAYYGEEAARNLELAGGKGHLYTLHDASHVLRGGKLRRNLGAPLRWRENVRKLAWKLGVR